MSVEEITARRAAARVEFLEELARTLYRRQLRTVAELKASEVRLIAQDVATNHDLPVEDVLTSEFVREDRDSGATSAS